MLISARRSADATKGTIERLDCGDGLIDVLVLLEDGSRGAARLLDDDVNSLELEAAHTVFVSATQS